MIKLNRGKTVVAKTVISKAIGRLFRIELIPLQNGYAEVSLKKYNKKTSRYNSKLVGIFQNNRLNGKAMSIYRQYRNVSDCLQTWNYKGDKSG